MAYAAPRTWASGDKPTAAQFNQDIRDNVSFLANPPACRVYHSTTQSLTDATETTLVFDSERYDTNSMHSTAVNTGRITFATAGLYLVTGHIELAAATDYADLYLMIRLNGAGSGIALVRDADPGAFSATRLLTVATVYKMAAADYVELRAYQDNTGSAARNVLATVARSPEFGATWIGLG